MKKHTNELKITGKEEPSSSATEHFILSQIARIKVLAKIENKLESIA